MTKSSRTWQTVGWALIALLACAFGVAGTARLAGAPVTGLTQLACAALLLAGLAHSVRSRGRGRLLAVLDVYAEREINRERGRVAQTWPPA